MLKNENKKEKTRLPKGLTWAGEKLIADVSITIVRVNPRMILFVRTPEKNSSLARRRLDTFGWASCGCDKNGKCKIVTTTSPDGSKITIDCKSDTCLGSCTLSTGTTPKRSGLNFIL